MKCIDQTIEVLCAEMKIGNTDRVIALAEVLGTILVARAMLADD